MSVATALSGPLPEAEHRSQLRKAVIASAIGTTIEWYDFFLYGVAAATVFPIACAARNRTVRLAGR